MARNKEKDTSQTPTTAVVSTPVSEGKITPEDVLPPWKIDLESLKDKASIDEAQKRINDWQDNLLKELHEVFTKNGVLQWQFTAMHQGMRRPILFSHGASYTTCRMAAAAYRSLKERVDQELALGD